jgi:hypothetical protein
LKTADYLSVERAHIAFVQSVFSALRADLPFLPVAIEGNQRDWVKARNHALAAKLDPILTERLPSLNVALSLNELGDLARASLREFIWTKVSVPDRFVLSFGYDYYIYVSGSRVSNSYARMADRAGLFSERLRTSPF